MKKIFIILFIFAACNSEKPADNSIKIDQPPADKMPEIKLDFIRTDLQMVEANNTYRQNKKIAFLELYKKHFLSNKYFYIHWLYDGDSLKPDTTIANDLMGFVTDQHVRDLLDSIQSRYPSNYPFVEKLTPIFQRLKYHLPNVPMPKIGTYVTGYERPGIETLDPVFISQDFSFAGIGLHYFLGPKFKYYPSDIPHYIRTRFTEEHIPVWLMREYFNFLHKNPLKKQKRPYFVEYIIQAGITLYFLDAMLPETHDLLKIFYTGDQMEWSNQFLKETYNEFLPNLYTQEEKQFEKYLYDRPYTPNLAKESPGRLAHFIGWQIVKKYVQKHPETKLIDLLETSDYDKIFKESGFKP